MTFGRDFKIGFKNQREESVAKKKNKKKKLFLPRMLVAKPSRPHTTKKGKKGYDRKERRRTERKYLEDLS